MAKLLAGQRIAVGIVIQLLLWELRRSFCCWLVSSDSCSKWLHAKCVGLTNRNIPDLYVCTFCEQTPGRGGGGTIRASRQTSSFRQSPLAHKSSTRRRRWEVLTFVTILQTHDLMLSIVCPWHTGLDVLPACSAEAWIDEYQVIEERDA